MPVLSYLVHYLFSSQIVHTVPISHPYPKLKNADHPRGQAGCRARHSFIRRLWRATLCPTYDVSTKLGELGKSVSCNSNDGLAVVHIQQLINKCTVKHQSFVSWTMYTNYCDLGAHRGVPCSEAPGLPEARLLARNSSGRTDAFFGFGCRIPLCGGSMLQGLQPDHA